MPSKTICDQVIPPNVRDRVQELDGDLNDGLITEKGYVKKKSKILFEHLSPDIQTKLKGLEDELKDEELTEKGYLNKVQSILAKFIETCSPVNGDTKEEASSNGKDDEKAESTVANGTTSNGSTTNGSSGSSKANGHTNGGYVQSSSQEETGTSQSEEEMDMDTPTSGKGGSKKKKKSKGSGGGDAGKGRKRKVLGDDERDGVEKKEGEKKDVEGEEGEEAKEESATPDEKTLRTSKRKRSPKADAKQPSIMSMFTKKPAKKEEEKMEESSSMEVDKKEMENGDNGKKEEEEPSGPGGKRIKKEEEEEEKAKVEPMSPSRDLRHKANHETAESKQPPLRCKECRQLLDDPDLKIFPGDPEDAREEYITLTDPRLSLLTGDEGDAMSYDERLQHKITNFCVYDKSTHICAFDRGMIEKNKELYFSGYVKPIYDDNPSTEGGIPTKRIGPINEWYTTGFDGGHKALIGFSTAFAEYIVMSPSEEYKPFWTAVQEKIYMSKILIEFLQNNVDPVYEDLLTQIETTVPPEGCNRFTEDSLLRHAQFVVEQVESYDDAADRDEVLLITMPCMRDLIKLAGVTLGKRRAARKAAAVKKDKKPVFTMATVTPLVSHIFDAIFKDQIADEMKAAASERKKRCGVCEICQAPDCGKCTACKDMIKFGGSGKAKQACKDRRCPNMAVQEADENDIDEMDNSSNKENKDEKKAKKGRKLETPLKKKKRAKVTWLDEPTEVTEERAYYKAAMLDDEKIEIGDCVLIHPDDPTKPLFMARVIYMWQESQGEMMFHAQWFVYGSETVLGETSDPLEVFPIDECQDTYLGSVNAKCTVIYKAPPNDWSMIGGIDDPETDHVIKEDDGKTFFYQKWYDPELARFEDYEVLMAPDDIPAHRFCSCCLKNERAQEKETARPGAKLEDQDDSSKVLYSSWHYKGNEFQIGDGVYLLPEVFSFNIKQKVVTKKPVSKKDVDEDLYPENYRKSSEYVKGSNLECPEPFRIGKIISIYTTKSNSTVRLRVNKMYRPEDTHKGRTAAYQADLNVLYWSEEEAVTELEVVQGKCSVVCAEDLNVSTDEYSAGGPHKFYFREAYDSERKCFEDPPSKSRSTRMKGKGKGKGKGKAKGKIAVEKEEEKESTETPFNKLKCLDVFAGCGGLSEGFHQAGICESSWAIEKEEPAAQAYRLNNPGSTVFSDDCNELLRLVMQGEKTSRTGQKLPQKGDVELLCGGPPCQGFSGMNRFNSREYSKFKNSLISSYLSYCDYYRPRFFLLENVRNFVSYKKNMVLKLALRCLIRMGYQCTFGILQAGQYGVPQTRRRAIILAAAPGEKLPFYPEPLHVFSSRACSLSVMIGEKKIESNNQWCLSAPYRTITVRDTMSDLPTINNGAQKLEISYDGEPQSDFQKKIRGNQYQPILRDHICKDMSSLVAARMKHIPLAPGSDWRDLPNIPVTLKDGTTCRKLRYTHKDKKNGKSSTGALRGVCSCAEGDACDPSDRQFSTLIPWCLPHTGNRHNNWAGLYGRLEWDGFFSTTVTNPEPMGKQGRVLHPEQHRVVSVRECARSQGFPDTYRFFGSILDKHRQIGNAVPPPMAAAIGMEIKVCLQTKTKRDQERAALEPVKEETEESMD
uniref:DNA (cytosine-5)-methyltransferase PliMCI n=1 Tax=Paracentrotus lividus TaxID=7656 RepID=DNMT1_PARLI|nr:RecName: Full=DNA (cytosine-5)-methyltransferase PliMCI; AltName: Full=DNA methyltransferase PliMCI; Short=DNA MTase PliMCI; Short=M.PliMCI; AltName: Full=Dnmt1; AltName: Full=MCMT [Paracentrotus lividus]CAA90563.1 DNA (cytosine-5-)-methyltransferase [Paracentrotus lividus]